MRIKTRQLPGRIAAGAFILSSGLAKRKADEQAATGVHGMAVGTYPFLSGVAPTTFVNTLSAGESRSVPPF